MATEKVAVCTGSGRPGGLGEAILSRMGKDGYRLVVTDVDGAGSNHLAKPDEMESVAESLRSQAPRCSATPVMSARPSRSNNSSVQ